MDSPAYQVLEPAPPGSEAHLVDSTCSAETGGHREPPAAGVSRKACLYDGSSSDPALSTIRPYVR
jgi:hypothetical protein